MSQPAVRPHGEMIIASVVATGLLLLMVHRFARWMAASVVRSRGEDSAPVSWRWRWTLCLVSGVLMIFVAAVAAIGIFHQIGWLSRSGVIYVAGEEPAVKAGLEYAQNLVAVLRKRDAGLSAKGPSVRREWSSEERAMVFSSYESEWSWMVTAPSHRQDGKIALYGRSRQIGWSWVIRYRELFPADRAQLERNAAIEAEVTSGVAAP